MGWDLAWSGPVALLCYCTGVFLGALLGLGAHGGWRGVVRCDVEFFWRLVWFGGNTYLGREGGLVLGILIEVIEVTVTLR